MDLKVLNSFLSKKQVIMSLAIFFIGLSTLFPLLQNSNLSFTDCIHDEKVVSPLKGDSYTNLSWDGNHIPSLSLQSFQQPKILFIIGSPSLPSSTHDIPFIDRIVNQMNFSVDIHDDDDNYEYEKYDAIVISRSIREYGAVDSLTYAPIPILTMEEMNCDEFRLGIDGARLRDHNYFYILNSSHYITGGLNENQNFYFSNDPKTSVTYLDGYDNIPAGVEIISLATIKSGDQNDKRTLITLDKGRNAWDLSPAPERRTFWGASYGSDLNSDGWDRWERTLKWVLYDDMPGNATINVHVKDLDNKDVLNAQVNLTDVINNSQTWTLNTTSDGSVSFISIPFGLYNITAEFEDSVNDSFSFLQIVGERTYHLDPNFWYDIQVSEYIDNSPPLIENVNYDNDTITFTADVFDQSALSFVYLNLTAINITDMSVEIWPKNFSMVQLSANQYYNDTALASLENSDVEVYYNIIVEDIANNSHVTEIFSFIMGDTLPPIIHDYDVQDFNNGTLVFYANITDDLSEVADPVILRINDSFVDMHLNSSGLWVYRTQAYYGLTLNYSIYSVKDGVGNENGSKVDLISPPFKIITPNDSIAPNIWGVSDTMSTHQNGLVEFSAYIDDWNDYQSGVNLSAVFIFLSINGIPVSSPMQVIGEISFGFEYSFNFNDTVYYRINASDLTGNFNPGFLHGPFVIDDNAIPQVVFGAVEFGNGTVLFNASVIDWPSNITSVTIYYTQNYFGTWSNTSMNNISMNLFFLEINDFSYTFLDVWYYVTAQDMAVNVFDPTPDEYQNIKLTDQVVPDVIFTVENSTVNDGEIMVTAWAKDYFGGVLDINNTFYVSFTHQGATDQFEMEYDAFYFYSFTQSFTFGESVTIKVWVNDSASNLGSKSKTIVIGDFAPPKILASDISEFQNGTVTFWAVIIDGPNGSGLPSENTSISLEYVFISIYREVMLWNGTGDVFAFSVSGFVPGNAFTYRITAVDNNNMSFTTEWVQAIIEDKTKPICEGYGHSEAIIGPQSTQLDFWVDSEDPFGVIETVNISLICFNGTTINHAMQYNGSKYVYSISLKCNTTFNYSIFICDQASNSITITTSAVRTYWGPVVIETDIEHTLDNNLIIWANVSDWGSGIDEVCLEYDFVSQGGNGGQGAALQVDTALMEFNGTFYVSSLVFNESGSITWTVIAHGSQNNLSYRKSSNTPYTFILPTVPPELADVLPLFFLVGFIPLTLAFFLVSVRKTHQRRVYRKKKREKDVALRYSDVLSIRSIICRNNSGLPFYTENFLYTDSDLDLTAGLTSAVSNLVSEVSQQELTKGKFDLLEREGFSILSHTNEYSTVSVVSEGRLSDFMRENIKTLHDVLENRLSQDQLEDPMFGDDPSEVQQLVYQYLMVGLLRPLCVDSDTIKIQRKSFTKTQRKWFNYVYQIPSLIDGQLIFYVMTFISILSLHGIPRAHIYEFLEKCYRFGILQPLSPNHHQFIRSLSQPSE